MTSLRPRLGFLAAACGIAALAAACSNSLGLPLASDENIIDTVSLWALDGTALSLPSGYKLANKSINKGVVRTDRSSDLDFAFNVDTLGRLVFLPTGALGLGIGSGLHRETATFDAIRTPENSGYTQDSAFVFDTGTVAVVRSRPGCSLGATIFFYAKLKVLAYDTVDHRVDFEILVNANCGYRSLQPGVPNS
jgi:hypothetical protein